jgi:hypothetical protein
MQYSMLAHYSEQKWCLAAQGSAEFTRQFRRWLQFSFFAQIFKRRHSSCFSDMA